MAEKITCTKCGRTRPETEFFKKRFGERYPMCKDCLCQYIDNLNPETFTWILELFDVPYIEQRWREIANRVYREKGQLTSKSVLGNYLRAMNMKQYSEYTYADSDRLNYENAKNEQEAAAAAAQAEQKEQDLKEKLEQGIISKAEYSTLSPTTVEAAKKNSNAAFVIPQSPTNDDIINQLTDEDYQYLNMKWGYVYRPDQWVTMETMYNRYANEYDLNIDREEVLKKMCKTSLKMDEALDAGDISSYKNLAAVFDQLRKSGKFTEAQNKEEKVRYLDTIGELVALAEKHGGPIKNELPDPDEYPQDKIDFTIKDMKAYTYSLVAGEPHMQDLIESFIQKYEKAEEAEKQFGEDFILSEEDELANAVTQEEAVEFENFRTAQIEADIAAEIAEFGDDNES